MNTKTKIMWLSLFGGTVVLTSCSVIDPAVQQILQDQIDALESAGTLTTAQATAATAMLDGALDWKSALYEILRAGAEVGLALLGVRMWRGGVNTRKGSPPTTA